MLSQQHIPRDSTLLPIDDLRVRFERRQSGRWIIASTMLDSRRSLQSKDRRQLLKSNIASHKLRRRVSVGLLSRISADLSS